MLVGDTSNKLKVASSNLKGLHKRALYVARAKRFKGLPPIRSNVEPTDLTFLTAALVARCLTNSPYNAHVLSHLVADFPQKMGQQPEL